MDYMTPIAHLAEDGRMHPLEEHLRGTAEWAAVLGCGKWLRTKCL